MRVEEGWNLEGDCPSEPSSLSGERFEDSMASFLGARSRDLSFFLPKTRGSSMTVLPKRGTLPDASARLPVEEWEEKTGSDEPFIEQIPLHDFPYIVIICLGLCT